MGSPLSPQLAILICMFYENKTLNSLSSIQTPGISFHGRRYVDDLISFFVVNLDLISDDNAQIQIDRLWKIFSLTYHNNMILEEESHDNSFKFLDAHVSIKNHLIQLSLHNKNTPFLQLNQGQRYFRFPHYNSAIADNTKLGTVVGMLHRAENFSSDFHQLQKSVNSLILEFSSL